MFLREIAREEVRTTGPEASIDDAMRLMDRHRIRHLPVVDPARHVVGILSNRDILSAVGRFSDADRVGRQEGAVAVRPQLVRDIMSAPVHTLAPHDRLEVGGRLLLDKRISALPLVTEDRLVGLVTEIDFLKCYFDDSNRLRGSWRFQRVDKLHQTDVHTLAPRDTLSKALRLMRDHRIRHIPIVDNRRLVGIISDRDIRLAIGEQLNDPDADGRLNAARGGTLIVDDIMSRMVATVACDAALAEAADQLVSLRIGALPVVSDDALVGIITETDLLRRLVQRCESSGDER